MAEQVGLVASPWKAWQGGTIRHIHVLLVKRAAGTNGLPASLQQVGSSMPDRPGTGISERGWAAREQGQIDAHWTS
jgi:hypothetical protein